MQSCRFASFQLFLPLTLRLAELQILGRQQCGVGVFSSCACSACKNRQRFCPVSSGTLFELSQVLHGHLEDSYGSSRVLIWRKLLALVPAHPLFGGGPGTLALRLDLHFSRTVAETGKTISTFVDNSHNVYLGILVNTGALSLAAYLAAMTATLRDTARSRAVLAAPLACALLCYWVQDFFGLGLFLVAPLMWIFWGLAAAKSAAE